MHKRTPYARFRRCFAAAWYFATAAALLGLSGATLSAQAPAAPSPIMVAASLPPLGYLAERVGGARVRVTVAIPAGRSPETYQPTPRDLSQLRGARLLVRAGGPVFIFEERLVTAIRGRSRELRELRLDAVARALPGYRMPEDPHLWLAPPVLGATAEELAAALAALDPDHRDGYRQRAAELIAELDALDRELRLLIEGSPCRTLLVDHPAWGGFAEHYGLRQLAVEVDGKEPGPASLAGLLREARAAGIRLIIERPGHPVASTRNVARILGAEIATVDPLAPKVLATLRAIAELAARSCAR